MNASPRFAERLRDEPELHASWFQGAELAAIDTLERRAGVSDEVVLTCVGLIVWGHRNGHSCVDLADLGGLVRAGDDGAVGTPPLPPIEETCDRLRSSPVVRVVDDEAATTADAAADRRPLVLRGTLLYSQRQFVDERSVAERIGALILATGAASGADDDLIARGGPIVDALLPTTPHDDRQNAAGHAFLRNRFNVLTGGPGTGKTYTLTRCLLAYLMATAPDGTPPDVAICAPTGKAAARAGEMLAAFCADLEDPAAPIAAPTEVIEQLRGIRPRTIHGLLGSNRRLRTRFAHDAHRHLPHDLVIVDETSMVPLFLMARLLEALGPDTRLLLVGDPGQLESVESGSVLRDLVDATDVLSGQVHELTRSYRVTDVGTAPNPIHALAPAIRSGDLEAVMAILRTPHPHLEFVEAPDGRPPGPEIVATIVDRLSEVQTLARSTDPADHARALEQAAVVKVLCGHRRGPFGVARWNDEIDRALGNARSNDLAIGRTLLVTTNSTRTGLVNGDVGVVVQTDAGPRVCFPAREQAPPVRTFGIAELPPVERTYASTIHKAQGSEYAENVVIVLPPVGSPLLTRELLYTAVTRARLGITIAGSAEAVKEALGNSGIRVSGLRSALSTGPG